MNNHRVRFLSLFSNLAAVFGLLMMNSCSQYEYTSPLPGTIDVKLHVISNNIAFDPRNNFVLKVTSVEAVRAGDNARAVILEDTKAIGRTTNVYNTLDDRARDSSLVMGEAFLPPADYIGINLLIQPGERVVLDGYRNIDVKTNTDLNLTPKFNPLLTFRRPFRIEELKTTNVVVTIDLDKSLVQLSNVYKFVPVYFISSITYN